MIEAYFFRTPTINRLRGGPLGSDLDDLANTLQQQGYAWDSIRHYLRGCDQFARWLSRHGYAVADVNPTLVKRYISDCNGLLRAACPKQPRDCPICSRSGISTSACQGQARSLLVRRPTNGSCDMSSIWTRSVVPLPAPVVTIS